MKCDKSFSIFTLVLIVLIIINSVFMIGLVEGQSTSQTQPFQPDIKVKNLQFSDEEPNEDDNITISATVMNNSTMPLQGLTLVFLIDGQEINNISGIGLNPDENKSFEISWKAEPGFHNVSALLRYQGVVLRDSVASKDIGVEPDPIGDIPSLLVSIAVIIIFIFSTLILHSISKTLRNSKSRG